MREILFRGKRVDNGEWVSGRSLLTVLQDNNYLYYIPQQGEDFKANPSIDNDRILSALFGNFYQVDPKTIGQYTGLKDKNGNKIFEGDIVTYAEDGIRGDFSQGAMEIVWAKKTANFCGRTEHANLVEIAHQKNVIGNIHDNPELLEVEG